MLSAHMQSLVKSHLQSISLVVDNPKSHNESTTTLSCSQLIALSDVVAQSNLNLFAASFVRLELESSRNPRRYVLPPALEDEAESPKPGSFEALVESFLADDINAPRVRSRNNDLRRSSIKPSVSSQNPPTCSQTPPVPPIVPRTRSLSDDTILAPPVLSRWSSDPVLPFVPRTRGLAALDMLAPPVLSRWSSDSSADSHGMIRPPTKPSNQPSPMSPVNRTRQSTAKSSIDDGLLLLLDDLSEEMMPPKLMMGSTNSFYSSSTNLTSFSSTVADSILESSSSGLTKTNGLPASSTKEICTVGVASTDKKHSSSLEVNKDSLVTLSSDHAAVMKPGESTQSLLRDHQKSSLCKPLPKGSGHSREGLVATTGHERQSSDCFELMIHPTHDKDCIDSCHDDLDSSFANYSNKSFGSCSNLLGGSCGSFTNCSSTNTGDNNLDYDINDTSISTRCSYDFANHRPRSG
jgi:hypothetical protein